MNPLLDWIGGRLGRWLSRWASVRMLAFGSGDPTRAICSTIDHATLAQAGLGTEKAFVVLTKDDFASPAALSIAEKILQKHFR